MAKPRTLANTVSNGGPLADGAIAVGDVTGLQTALDAKLDDSDVGVTVQPYDADLTSWAGIAPSAKQDALVSGTNIKTVNGGSVLGTGDLAVGDATLAGAQTFTGTKTFAGTSSALAMVLNDAAEVATVSATAATGTINFDVTTQSVLFFTSNASGNWTLNVRASSGTSLNTALATGQSITIAFLVTNGGTAFYQTGFQVDGNAVTPRWQGGTAPTAGNASSIDVYVFTVIKTGSAAFTVLASQTKFA